MKVEEEKKDEAFDKKEAEAAPGAPQEKKNDEKDEAFVKKEAEAAPEAAEKSAVDVKKEAGTETPATEAAGTGASDGPKEDEKKKKKKQPLSKRLWAHLMSKEKKKKKQHWQKISKKTGKVGRKKPLAKRLQRTWLMKKLPKLGNTNHTNNG